MGLRDIAIVGIVLLLALLSVRRPWIGVMNWTWLSIMNPHRYAWGFAYNAPVAAIAGISTVIGLLFTRDRQSPFKGTPVVWLLAFTVWMTISWLLGYDPQGDYPQWDKVIKIYLMTFVTLSLLSSKLQIMAFVWVTAGSLAFLAAKGGVFTVLTGGDHRVWGPSGSFIADNNHFALAVIVAIPILHFLQLQLKKNWHRHAMTMVILMSAAAAIGSYSRGALLALIATGAVFWWRSAKKVQILLAIVVALILILPMMPAEWWERMYSIKNYEDDASVMGRFVGWSVAFEVATHYPFGGGMSYQHEMFFRAFSDYSVGVIAAHSIYFQILGNHGFVGLFLYVMIWITTFRSASYLRRVAKRDVEAKWAADLGAMVQVSLVGFGVGGAFLSMPYFDLPYNLMVAIVLAREWVERKGWESDSDVGLMAAAGIGARQRAARVDERGRQ